MKKPRFGGVFLYSWNSKFIVCRPATSGHLQQAPLAGGRSSTSCSGTNAPCACPSRLSDNPRTQITNAVWRELVLLQSDSDARRHKAPEPLLPILSIPNGCHGYPAPFGQIPKDSHSDISSLCACRAPWDNSRVARECCGRNAAKSAPSLV